MYFKATRVKEPLAPVASILIQHLSNGFRVKLRLLIDSIKAVLRNTYFNGQLHASGKRPELLLQHICHAFAVNINCGVLSLAGFLCKFARHIISKEMLI